ncbi:hypothetical protein LTR36_000720 [Oleoguttula mirabilis]|uniref:DUF7137 domain-containing protein n=1 Tax=Oleoguttula mirabilis TaxID=1507867 RepID=A0AAV9JQS9_9PEZI|nr:hypothetical protein LTR36_000720 [Oleoguttula mirabilis]
MRSTALFTPICLFAAASSAWPSVWPRFEAVKREIAPLVVRADTTYDLSYSATQGNTATTVTSETATNSDATSTATGSDATSTATGSDASATGTGSDASSTGTEKSSGKTTGTGKTTSTGKTTTSKSSTTTFAATAADGGISLITPDVLSGSQYYKIGTAASKEYVTFAWNYTSLSVTPSAVDILASCSLNSATYTIAMNQSITGSTQAFTWDTGAYQATASVPLLTETYTLIIHDAAKDVSATAQPGYLSVYDTYIFGMYVPQSYTPLADWTCATCSGAMSSIERQALGFSLGMAALTVLSFSWFAGVAGLW